MHLYLFRAWTLFLNKIIKFYVTFNYVLFSIKNTNFDMLNKFFFLKRSNRWIIYCPVSVAIPCIMSYKCFSWDEEDYIIKTAVEFFVFICMYIHLETYLVIDKAFCFLKSGNPNVGATGGSLAPLVIVVPNISACFLNLNIFHNLIS